MVENDAYVIKAKFKVLQGQEKIAIMICPTIHKMKNRVGCMQVFRLVGLERHFHLPPCKVDPKRVHKMMTTLKEYGTFQLTYKDKELVEVRINGPMVSAALLVREGNHQFSNLELENKEKLCLFLSLTASEQTYDVFLHLEVSLPLQIY